MPIFHCLGHRSHLLHDFSYLIMRHCDQPSSRGIRFKCETRSFELPLPYSSSPTKKQDNMKPHISKQGKRVSDCNGLRRFKFRHILIFNRWLVLYIFFSLALRVDDLGVQHLIWSFETRVWAQFKATVQRRRIEVPFEGMPETKKDGFTVQFRQVCVQLSHSHLLDSCFNFFLVEPSLNKDKNIAG